VSALAPLREQPHRFSLFAALRLLERHAPDKPRIGEARRTAQVVARLGQPPFLDFAPAEIATFRDDGDLPQLEAYGFGMFGPNGSLPLHLTELAWERRRHFSDPSISDFINLFQHRMLELFYRAWADADPAATHDRPDADHFRLFLGAFTGLAPVAARHRLDGVHDDAVLGRAGLLGMQTHPAEALRKATADYFQLPVEVVNFIGEWLDIPVEAQTRLGAADDSASLGIGATLGQKSWQVQHGAGLVIGALDYGRFCDFLPGEPGRRALEQLLGLFGAGEWNWHLRFKLRRAEAPPLRLGEAAPGQRPAELGWSTWLGEPPRTDTVDITIDLGPACLLPSVAGLHPKHRKEPQLP
jgi:type VI secretion system protein ImpH